MATLVNATITAALTANTTLTNVLQVASAMGVESITLQANFTYGSSGTTAVAYVQTTLDGGTTWCDIANFAFATTSAIKVCTLSALTPVTTVYTPVDGSLASNTVKDGVLGTQFRVKLTTTGTYATATTLRIDAIVRGRVTV